MLAAWANQQWASPGADGNLYPDPDISQGAFWTFIGDCDGSPGVVGPNGADVDHFFMLVSDSASSSDLQVILSPSTTYRVSLEISDFVTDPGGGCLVSLGGTPVGVGQIAGNGPIGPFEVITPAASGDIFLIFRHLTIGICDFNITHIEIIR